MTLADVTATARPTRNHAFLVFDTLYGLDEDLLPQPQMVAGHTVGTSLVLLVIGDAEQLGPAADLSASSLQTRVQVSIQRKSDLAITEIVTPHPLIYAQLGK